MRVLVIGDIILDRYIWGEVERICPEAPVPVVDVTRETSMLGGAANVVTNLRSLGVQIHLFGVVGNDIASESIRAHLKQIQVNAGGLIVDAVRPTSQKTRVVAGHQQVVRFDHEDRTGIDVSILKRGYDYIQKIWSSLDGVILSDYGKGVISPSLISFIESLNGKDKKIIAVDPKERNMHAYQRVTLVTPNRNEAGFAVGQKLISQQDVKEAGLKILNQLNCENVVITLGAHGMALFERSGHYLQIPTFAKEVFDVSGAGDTVIAVLTLALCCGATLSEAVALANYAAGVVVGKLGTATVTPQELKKYIQLEKFRLSKKNLTYMSPSLSSSPAISH